MELTIDFSPTTYDAVRRECEKIFQKVLDEISNTIAKLRMLPAISAAIWQPVVEWLGEAAAEVGSFLKDLLQGIAAPVMFFTYAWRWIEDIGNPAATTEANISPTAGNLPVFRNLDVWTGSAGDAYRHAVATQTTAANVVSSRAWYVAATLGTLAAAGLAFYAALVKIGVELAAGITAATATTVATVGVAAPTIPAVIIACVAELVVTATVMAGVQAGSAFALSQWSTEGGVFVGDSWPAGTADFAG